MKPVLLIYSFPFLSVDSNYLPSAVKKNHGKCVLSLFLWNEKLCKVPRILPGGSRELSCSFVCAAKCLDSWKIITFSMPALKRCPSQITQSSGLHAALNYFSCLMCNWVFISPIRFFPWRLGLLQIRWLFDELHFTERTFVKMHSLEKH